MTVSKHEVTAVVAVGLGVTLDVIDARITLDDGWMPYIQAELTCWTPEEAELELLDPREQLRVTLTVTKEFGTWNAGQLVDQARTFDLLLRGRTIDHTTGTMVLIAESDESLLEDLALVATSSERVYGVNVKTAVEYALTKIGASLEAGASDAEIESAEIPDPVTNLITNPSFETSIGTAFNGGAGSTWGTGGNGTVTQSAAQAKYGSKSVLYTWTASATADVVTYFGQAPTAPDPAEAGITYKSSLWVYCSKSQRMSARLAFTNSAGVFISEAVGTEVVVPASTWTQLEVTATAPALTAGAYLLARVPPSGTGYSRWTSGNLLYVDGLMRTIGTTLEEYFDGSTPGTGLVDYAWTGTAHASTSTRTSLPNSDVMIWQPGVIAWGYLEPLLQATGLRLYCNENREWILEPSGTARAGQVNIAAGINVTDASDQISRREEWYDSVVVIYTRDASWMQSNTYDIAGAPGTKTLVLEYDRPYPGPGAAQAVLNRAQGRGRILRLESISDYTATPGMTLSASLPDSPIQTGTISSVEWSWPADRMTIGSRGLTDTPPEAWLLVEELLAWEDIATGVDWTEYTS